MKLVSQSFAAALLVCAVATGCDSVDPAPSPSSVVVETDMGVAVQVSLVPGTPGAHIAFSSRDEAEAALDQRASLEAVSVNQDVWERVGHALPPSSASIFDADGKVRIGRDVYEARRDGIYRQSAPNSAWTVDLYYGEDGLAESREYDLVYANSGTPERLSDLEIRNPHVREMADEIAKAGGIDNVASRATRLSDCQPDCDVSNYTWDNFAFGYTTSDITASGRRWRVRFLGYNYSSGRLWYKKANAGMQPQVLATTDRWSAIGVNNPSFISAFWDYEVTVYGSATRTKKDGCTSQQPTDFRPAVGCYSSPRVTVGRNSGFEARSFHTYSVYSVGFPSGYNKESRSFSLS